MKLYRLTVCRIVGGRIVGAKSTTETLSRAYTKLVKLCGPMALVRSIIDRGHFRCYSIVGRDVLAELEPLVDKIKQTLSDEI